MLTVAERPAGVITPAVYDFNPNFGGSDDPTRLRVAVDPSQATANHLQIVDGSALPWHELPEHRIIQQAVLSQIFARHVAAASPESDLLYRMTQTGQSSNVTHLVPRYPSLDAAGDPIQRMDKTSDRLILARPAVASLRDIASRLAVTSELAETIDARLAHIGAFYNLDYSRDMDKENGAAHDNTPGTDILDKIMGGAIKAREIYRYSPGSQDDYDPGAISVIVDLNPATREHVFATTGLCVPNWEQLPEVVVAQMAVLGQIITRHLLQKNPQASGVQRLIAANQIRHPHEHYMPEYPHQGAAGDPMQRMNPTSDRMKDPPAGQELDAVLQKLAFPSDLAEYATSRMRHIAAFYRNDYTVFPALQMQR